MESPILPQAERITKFVHSHQEAQILDSQPESLLVFQKQKSALKALLCFVFEP